MDQGHHGANHPVKDFETDKIEIVSMNHGFSVDSDSMPEGVVETHKSLFDGSNCGLRLQGKPVFPCSTTRKRVPALVTVSIFLSDLRKCFSLVWP